MPGFCLKCKHAKPPFLSLVQAEGKGDLEALSRVKVKYESNLLGSQAWHLPVRQALCF